MKRVILAVLLAFILSSTAFGVQNTSTQELRIVVQPVALLDVSLLTVVFEIPQEIVPGAPLHFENIEGGNIRYTSLIEQGRSRKITASLVDTSILDYVEIGITVAAPEKGTGKLGVSTGRISLSSIPQPVIADIGNGWTGTEETDGASVFYDIDILSADNLGSGTVTIDVLSTLAEE